MQLVFIIFFVLLVITIIFILVHSRNKNKLSQFCSSNSDCPSGYLCKPNPYLQNKKQCVKANQVYCPITPVTELVKCRLDATGYCSDTCLNVPKFSCIQVDPEHPYIWKQGDRNVRMPNSPTNYGWCLPDVINRQVPCNQFTSDYVLEQVGDNQYQWGCYCRYPNLFDHGEGPGSDCTSVRACGHLDSKPLGSMYVPKPYGQTGPYNFKSCTGSNQCDSGDICLGAETMPIGYPCGYLGPTGGYNKPPTDCSNPDSKCVCHTNWLNIPDKINPLAGQCVCNSGLDFRCTVHASDYFSFECASQKNCYPYDIDSNSANCAAKCHKEGDTCLCCLCPTGYIRCPDDITTNTSLQEFCILNTATCIPDPCNTSSSGPANGYWNTTLGACICASGFIAVDDTNSAVGAVCLDPCSSSINPCGNRGTCFVQNGQAQCTNCVAPYTNEQDTTCTCSQEDPNTGVGDGAECCSDDACASKQCGGYPNCGDVYEPGHCTGVIPVIWPPPSNPGAICIPSKAGPVICGTGSTASCPQENVCCQNTSGSWNCCPFSDGVCCSDNIHCCPGNFPICNIQSGYCVSSDGKSYTGMSNYSGPN